MEPQPQVEAEAEAELEAEAQGEGKGEGEGEEVEQQEYVVREVEGELERKQSIACTHGQQSQMVRHTYTLYKHK